MKKQFRSQILKKRKRGSKAQTRMDKKDTFHWVINTMNKLWSFKENFTQS